MFNPIEDIRKLLSNPIQHDGTFEVFQLEQKLSLYYDKEYCLLMSNASMALYSCILCTDLEKKHVIAPAFGWSGSIASLLHFENRISFAEVDQDYCLDPHSIEELLLPDTEAIISIDTGGAAADSKRIADIAKAHGLLYISDSAESLGACRDDLPAGAFADVLVVSFTNGKTINTGEMGALLTNEKWIYEKIVKYTQHPHRQKKVVGPTNWYPFSPLNSRVHPISAIVANSEFEMLERIMALRLKNALHVIEELVQEGTICQSQFVASRTTFFEYFAKKSKSENQYRKCDSSHDWFIHDDLTCYNLYDLTRLFYEKSVVTTNAIDLKSRIDNTLKIQFNW